MGRNKVATDCFLVLDKWVGIVSVGVSIHENVSVGRDGTVQ